MKLKVLELLLILLIAIQIIITGYIFVLDPILQQEHYALFLAMDFIVTAMFLYVYVNENKEFDEEWLAIGIASFTVILLTIIFLVRL